MNKQKKIRLETRASVLKALAHPIRLFMLEELEEKSNCVQELTEKTGLDVSTISKHLAVLKNAGFVTSEKRGKQVFYSVRLHCALNFLECVEAVLKAQVQDKIEACQNPLQ